MDRRQNIYLQFSNFAILLYYEYCRKGFIIMENCLFNTEIYYKDIEEYKNNVDTIIKHMIAERERLVFAVVAEKAGVTRFVVRQYPELRNYILTKMVYYKELHVINSKINRAVDSLIKANKSITFMSIVKKCRYNLDVIYENEYIKNRIKEVLIQCNNR